jgi:hypothetical protein
MDRVHNLFAHHSSRHFGKDSLLRNDAVVIQKVRKCGIFFAKPNQTILLLVTAWAPSVLIDTHLFLEEQRIGFAIYLRLYSSHVTALFSMAPPCW